MAFFNVAQTEKLDTLTETFDKGFNTSVREAEAKPTMFEGDLLGAIGSGIESGFNRSKYNLYADSVPEEMARKKQITDSLIKMRPDPKTLGSAGQLMFGLAEPLSFMGTEFLQDPIGSVLSAPLLAMNITKNYEPAQTQINIADGMDPKTAAQVARTSSVAMGAGAMLPVSVAGNLAMRVLTGGALNVAVGAGERAETGRILRSNGYEDMAKQYSALDGNAALAEFVLGGAFGGIFGGRAKVRVPSESILPSHIDSALAANQSVNASVDLAPGVPTNGRSAQAHSAALDAAIEQLAFGRKVNVENLLTEAGFLGKRPDFDATSIIREELEKAGFNDVAAKVRDLETAAKDRGLYVEPADLNVVLSDKPADVTVGGLKGREAAVKIGNDYVPVEYRIMEAGDVRATMDKADNQYRDRTRVASEQQIQEAAADLDPRLLGESPVMDYGAPVMTADGKIIAGNGRAAFIERAYETNGGEAYRSYLKESAEALGLNAGDMDGMQRPVLVRVLQRDVDVNKASILSNEGGAMGMSALEQAKVDGERLGDFRAFQFGEDGSVSNVGNMPFIRAWVEKFPTNQRSRLMDSDGMLSAEGNRRLQNGIMYRAYGDSDTLSRLVEATDPGSRNIVSALSKTAARVADAKEKIARGELYPLDLSDDLLNAVEKIDSLKRSGQTVDSWVAQLDAFGDGMSGEARALVVMMDRNIRSARAIGDAIDGYYARLNALGNPGQGSMFEAATPTKQDVFAPMLDASEVMYSLGGELRQRPYSQAEMLERGADGHLSKAYERYIPLEKLDGLEPVPSNNLTDDGEYYAGTKITQPIEVIYDSASDAYIVYGGNHRIAQARANGQTHILAFVEPDTSSGRDYIGPHPSRNNPDAEMYSRTSGTASNVADLTSTFKAQFGKDADKLIAAARVEIVQSVSDLPARSDATAHPGDVGGMYDPRTGMTYIVADNTAPSQVRGRVLHEIGVHAGFETMLGDTLYADVLAQVDAKISSGDARFVKARALAEQNAARPEHVPQETLAYLVENAPEMKLSRQILAAVRQWLYRVTGGRFVDLGVNDLVSIASASLRRQARIDGAAMGGDAPMYTRAQESTPEFKSWFGASKVVDDGGEPLVVYHGSSKDIDIFNTQGGSGKTFDTGAFFSSNPATANTYTGGINGGNLVATYLNLKTPAVIDAKGLNWNRIGKNSKVDLPEIKVADQADEDLLAALEGRESVSGSTTTLKARSSTLGRLFPDEFLYDDFFSTDELARWARKQGYDGLIVKNVMDMGPSGIMATKASSDLGSIFVAFRPEQIKSATGNSGAFNPDSPSLTDRVQSVEDFHRDTNSGDTIQTNDNPLPTTMIPTGSMMETIEVATAKADANIATADQMQPGFLSAIECALVAGE